MSDFLVQIRNATVYRNDTEVLKGIDWTVRPRENWAIVGNNGSGKTTLMKVIFGELLPVEGGEIFWFGRRVWRGLREVRERMGFVSAEYQNTYDRNVTGLEVVASGFFATIGIWVALAPAQRKTALDFMDHLGIAHLANQLYRSLSYGEARRLLLARALVHRPSLLVLDEPCAGLDIPTREHFLQTLQTWSRKTRMIYVTHHIEEVLPAITHVLMLKNGRILHQGEKADTLTDARLSDTLGCRVTLQCHGQRYWLSGCHLPAKKKSG